MAKGSKTEQFSAEWTAEERLLLVIVMTDLIRDDVNAGRYSAIGRPNVQSVHEMIVASREELEAHRKDIDKMLKDWSRGDNAQVAALFETNFHDLWEGRL